MIVVAQLYGVLQLTLLGWAARSVRWGVLVVAVGAGLYAAAPAAITLEWVICRVCAAVSGRSLASVVELASYTVDPFVEETVKIAPVALLWWALRPVRSWGRTDILLVTAAIGSGFGLAEHLLRYSGDADRAVSAASGGWVIPASMFAGLRVPGPRELLGSWLPSGVGTDSYLAGNAADLVNIHLAWSALAGLGLGLLLRPPRERARPARVFGVLLIGWVGLDHAMANARGGGGTATSLAAPFTTLRAGLGVYVLVALAVAVALDRVVLARRLDAHPELRLAREGFAGLLTLASVRLPWSVPAVCGFVRTRRCALFARGDDESPSPPALLRLRAALDTADDRAWQAVDLGMRDRLTEVLDQVRRPRAVVVGWLALLVLPALYFLVGGQPLFSGVQGWFGTSGLFWLTVLVAVTAGALTAWGLVAGLRAMPVLLRAGAVDRVVDPLATAGLLVLARGGALLLTVFGLARVARGRRATDPLLSSSHALEAVGQSLLVVGLLLAAAALLLTFPPGGMLVPVLVGGDAVGAAAAVEAAATLAGRLAVGSLAGWLLTEAAGSGGAGRGSGSGSGGAAPNSGATSEGNAARFPEDDFEGTGFSADEIGAMAYRHTGAGDMHVGGGGIDRPTETQIMEALGRGRYEELPDQNAVQYVLGRVKVIVNRDLPWRSTAYQIGS